MKVVVNGLGGAGGDQDTENTELMAIYTRENQSADKVENCCDSCPGPGCRGSHGDCTEAAHWGRPAVTTAEPVECAELITDARPPNVQPVFNLSVAALLLRKRAIGFGVNAALRQSKNLLEPVSVTFHPHLSSTYFRL